MEVLGLLTVFVIWTISSRLESMAQRHREEKRAEKEKPKPVHKVPGDCRTQTLLTPSQIDASFKIKRLYPRPQPLTPAQFDALIEDELSKLSTRDRWRRDSPWSYPVK